MKILILGLNYAPDIVGIAKYTTEMAEWLVARGHDVRVVTAPPYYPAWQVSNGYSGHSYRREKRNGISVLRCPLYVPKTPSGNKRLAHLTSFAVSSFPAVVAQALAFRPHVVFAVAPALFCALGALTAARVSGARSWLHLQDFEIDAAFDLGLLRGRVLRRLAFAGERALLRSFDCVSTISPQMVQLLLSKGCAPERTYELRNWADTAKIKPMAGASPYRRDLGLGSDDVLLLYSGTIARKQGLELVIEAARRCAPSQRLRFLICGDGPGKVDLETSAAGLPNASFLPLQPVQKLNDLLNAADIHLLPQLAGAADLVLPSKLTGMLASGRPVIATAAPGTGLASEIEDCGIAVRPGDVLALVDAIEGLAADPHKRELLGARARMRAERAWSIGSVLGALEARLRASLHRWEGAAATPAIEQ